MSLKYTVDGVIVVGGEKHGLFIEKCGQQGIENGIGLACSIPEPFKGSHRPSPLPGGFAGKAVGDGQPENQSAGY